MMIIPSFRRIYEDQKQQGATEDGALRMALAQYLATCEELNKIISTSIGKGGRQKRGLWISIRWVWHDCQGAVQGLRKDIEGHQRTLTLILTRLIRNDLNDLIRYVRALVPRSQIRLT